MGPIVYIERYWLAQSFFRSANITSQKNLMWHADHHTQTPQLSNAWYVTGTVTSHDGCYKDDQFLSLPSRIMVCHM